MNKLKWLQAVEKFSYAAYELLKIWENDTEGTGSEAYPFQASFDDVAVEIADWAGVQANIIKSENNN